MAIKDNGYVDILMWVGPLKDKPKDKFKDSRVIPSSSIASFELVESMFSLLPSLYILLGDSGTWEHRKLLRCGDVISVIITPRSVDASTPPALPLIKAEYAIQTMTKTMSDNSNLSGLKLFCVYNAPAYLNEIPIYPEETIDCNSAIYKKVASTEVMQTILSQTSVGFVPLCKTNDKSYWVNCNETRARFIDRIFNHIWVDDDDAPVSWIDANGIMYLDSLKNMISNVSTLSCEFTNGAMRKDAKDASRENTIIIDSAVHVNAGQPILNQGGYKLSYSLYNPYNNKELNNRDFKKFGSNGALANVATSVTAEAGSVKDPSDGHRVVEYEHTDKWLADLSNKRIKDMITANVSGGMHFAEMHEHYNVAPKHNENIRRSFFTNFILLAIDTTPSRQAKQFGTNNYRFQLGKIITCNFTREKTPDSLHSGKYLICKIRYRYEQGKPFMINATVVNDGYYSLGE